MKRSDVHKQIRFLSLIEEREVSATDLDMLIDEAYGIIEGKRVWPWAIVPEPGYINTTKGARRYSISIFSHVVAVIGSDDGIQLRSVSLQEISTTDWRRYGKPEVFAVEADKIVLSPTPDESCQNYDVIYTKAKPWTLNSDSPPFEPEFHTILVDWALHRLWEREEDFDRSDRYRGRFEARLVDMKRFYDSRAQDRPLIFGVNSRDIRQPLRPLANPTVKGRT